MTAATIGNLTVATIFLVVVFTVIGVCVTLNWIFSRKPTTNDLRDFTGTH